MRFAVPERVNELRIRKSRDGVQRDLENLIVEWCGGWAFQQVLKTDVFHDAVGEGKWLERMPTESFLPKMKSLSNIRLPDMLICERIRGRTGRLEKRERGGSAGLSDFPIQQKHVFRWNLRVIIPEDENRGRFDCRIRFP